jgi:putative membrane-bound dehydrogenase-like protein
MLCRVVALLAFIVLLLPGRAPGQDTPHGLKVPPGFEVTEFADASLANDIYCMTLDPKGRVVVGGRGYIKILVDDDGDGKADRAIAFADRPKDGAMGLFWEGKHLYVTGDGGLQRFTTTDGDHADGPPQLIRKMKTGTEHGAHAILRGPDGWLYVLCGNNTNIDKSFAELPTSPVKDPIAGCVLRFTPDLKKSEIVADGFRNPYCFDFNSDGELFTWDADNERCVSLPWYEGTRFYHVIPGGNYGWMNPQIMETWRKPPYFLDVVAPVIDLGRGSPTGVTCYRHVQFPEKYRNGFFCCDWTFGKVWFLPLKRSGASYKTEKELFLQAVGDNGFAPTASVVHPETGDLYISIGGRGTRGAVYRIRYTAGVKGANAAAAAKLQPAKRSLDFAADKRKSLLDQASSPNGLDRLNALILLRRHADQFTDDERLEAFNQSCGNPDRYVRLAAAALLAMSPKEKRAAADVSIEGKNLWPCITYLHASVGDKPDWVVRVAGLLLEAYGKDADNDQILAFLRLMQLGMGDLGDPKTKGTIWEGYSPRLTVKGVRERIGMLGWIDATGGLTRNGIDPDKMSPEVVRELTRTWILLEKESRGYPAFVERWFSDAKFFANRSVADDLHMLIVVARWGICKDLKQERIADLLLSLGPRLEKQGAARERNWWSRLGELHAALAKHDPTFNDLLLKHPSFVRPDHVLFTKTPGFDRKKAAALFLKKVQDDPQFPWSADLVLLLGELPPEQSLPFLRQQWGKTGYDAVFLQLLAKQPDGLDRDKFVAGLSSSDLSTVRACLAALAKLPLSDDKAQTAALIRALGTLPDGKEAQQLRTLIADRLQRTTKQNFATDRNAWLKWFATIDPQRAAALANPDGVDVATWDKRLAKLDWSKSDAARGKAVFLKANCNACHNGPTAIGPTLEGIANRFSREDLFTAILQPSKDISPRFQTTIVETTSGKIYQGIIVYEAVDSLILVTGPAQNVRIPGGDVASKSVSRLSLMPAGLLDNLLDQEIVDLYAYLKSLSASK